MPSAACLTYWLASIDNIFGNKLTPADAGETGGISGKHCRTSTGPLPTKGPSKVPNGQSGWLKIYAKGDFNDTSKEAHEKNKELNFEGKSIDVDLKSTNP